MKKEQVSLEETKHFMDCHENVIDDWSTIQIPSGYTIVGAYGYRTEDFIRSIGFILAEEWDIPNPILKFREKKYFT